MVSRTLLSRSIRRPVLQGSGVEVQGAGAGVAIVRGLEFSFRQRHGDMTIATRRATMMLLGEKDDRCDHDDGGKYNKPQRPQ